MSEKIEKFTVHNELGESVLAKDLPNWGLSQHPWRPFNTAWVSWNVGAQNFQLPTVGRSIWELPDSSGLICFEEGYSNNNCFVLDARGNLRYRLTVPSTLTGKEVPNNSKMYFIGISSHMTGKFGIDAWIENVGRYYFELDYSTGSFLWGKEIRD